MEGECVFRHRQSWAEYTSESVRVLYPRILTPNHRMLYFPRPSHSPPGSTALPRTPPRRAPLYRRRRGTPPGGERAHMIGAQSAPGGMFGRVQQGVAPGGRYPHEQLSVTAAAAADANPHLQDALQVGARPDGGGSGADAFCLTEGRGAFQRYVCPFSTASSTAPLPPCPRSGPEFEPRDLLFFSTLSPPRGTARAKSACPPPPPFADVLLGKKTRCPTPPTPVRPLRPPSDPASCLRLTPL